VCYFERYCPFDYVPPAKASETTGQLRNRRRKLVVFCEADNILDGPSSDGEAVSHISVANVTASG
jgi:hypothetical protein